MNQPTLSRPEDRTMVAFAQADAPARRVRHVPAGPRAFVTWPVEFEVEPWRP